MGCIGGGLGALGQPALSVDRWHRLRVLWAALADDSVLSTLPVAHPRRHAADRWQPNARRSAGRAIGAVWRAAAALRSAGARFRPRASLPQPAVAAARADVVLLRRSL